MNAIASLSVLLATRDRAPSLKITPESLRRVTLPENVEVELVVVDNASTDGTKAEVEAFIASAPPLAVRYLYCARGGKSAALNLGLAEIGSDLVVFTDDDMSFDGNWLVAFVEHFREHQCAGAQGRVCLQFDGPQPGWLTPKAEVLLAATSLLGEQVRPLSSLGGLAMAVRGACAMPPGQKNQVKGDLAQAPAQDPVTSSPTDHTQKILQDETYSMNPSPYDVGPVGSVPQPTDKEDQQNIERPANFRDPIPSQRQVEIVSKPGGEGDVPTAPEIGKPCCQIGTTEVGHQLKSHHPGRTHSIFASAQKRRPPPIPHLVATTPYKKPRQCSINWPSRA